MNNEGWVRCSHCGNWVKAGELCETCVKALQDEYDNWRRPVVKDLRAKR